jgi:ATP-dependent DNA helicase RecG
VAIGFLQNPIEYLKGVGPLRADLLKKELGIFTYEDLLNHFPFRHIDRTRVSVIGELTQEADFAQVAGVVLQVEILGQRAGKRLVAQFKDKTGIMELTWFK